MDLIIFSPPAASAGKNFTTSNPSSIACSTSLGFAVPGVTGTPFSIQYFTTFGLIPGLTRFCSCCNCTVYLLCCQNSTCPYQHLWELLCHNADRLLLLLLYECHFCTWKSAVTECLSKGAASFASFNTTTGTTRFSESFLILRSWSFSLSLNHVVCFTLWNYVS